MKPTNMARNSEFQAAPHRAPQKTSQPPKPVVKELREEHCDGVRALFRHKGSEQHLGDGKEYKRGDDGDHTTDGADDEDVSVNRPTRGDTLGQKEQKTRRADHRAIAHAELPIPELSETRLPANRNCSLGFRC